MKPYHILVIEDDDLMRRSLVFGLEQAGYRASSASNAEDALLIFQRDPPDLFVLDIGLPGMDGLTALKAFKQQTLAPVVILTARRRDQDQILGLELGADDYIAKPVNLDVFLARIKAVLRRYEQPQPAVEKSTRLVVGDMTLDPISHKVLIRDQPVDLSPREFALLHAFALRPGEVISIDELLASVWGAEYAGQFQVVYVHIRWLRKKIEADPDHPHRILTVQRVGYRLEPQEI